MNFQLNSNFQPSGDQPEAIRQAYRWAKPERSFTNLTRRHRIRQNIHHCQCIGQYKSTCINSKP